MKKVVIVFLLMQLFSISAFSNEIQAKKQKNVMEGVYAIKDPELAAGLSAFEKPFPAV